MMSAVPVFELFPRRASGNAGAREFGRAAVSGDGPESGIVRTAADRDARLRAMVDAHFEFIWRSLRGLGVPAANVDDAAQQVFWIAAQKLDRITVGSERAFLFSTARGVAANARRARARSREQADDGTLELMSDASLDPEQAAQKSQAKQLLERILSEMNDDLRTVFVLFELEGLTSVEIAELLSIPIGTAASRLRRAREEFQLAVTKLQLGGPR
jgi:RNA polymerase sigma-70 factor (ECF subfamily)